MPSQKIPASVVTTGKKTPKIAGALTALFLGLSATAAMAGTPAMPDANPLAGDNVLDPAKSPPEAPYLVRGLTAGETKAIRGVFGNEIDLSSVTLRFFSLLAPNCGYLQSKKSLNDCGEFGRVDDLTKGGSRAFNLFMYNVTTMLQAQRGSDWKFDGYGGPTWLQMIPQKTFDEYSVVEQRQIIADYASRYLHPGRLSWEMGNSGRPNSPEADAMLRKTVEDKFPNAAKARAAFQKQSAQPAAPACDM